MAIDFPTSPTVGQVFTSGGLSWTWDGVKWAASTTTQAPTGAPNKLINPFMEIDQANEGAVLAVVSGSGPYVTDGFMASYSVGAGTMSVQRSTDAPPGYPNSLIATVTATGVVAAGSYFQLLQNLEADDLADIAFGTSSARTLSVAFWVKSSVAGTYSGALVNTASNRSYVWNFALLANTWTLISQTIAGDTAGTWVLKGNGIGVSLRVGIVAGSNFQSGTPGGWVGSPTPAIGTASNSNSFFNANGSTFQLGPCGLWVAPAPQPLLRTSFQAELARCQRYYEKSFDIGAAPGTASSASNAVVINGAALSLGGNVYAYKVSKRATPTVTAYSTITGAAGKIRDSVANADITASMFGATQNSVIWYGTPVATGTINFYANFVADARL